MPTRRTILKTAALTLVPLVGVNARLAFAAEKVSLDDPAVVALKYVEDATTATRAEKMGVAGSDQTCLNCQFYAGGGTEGGCMLFQNKLVAATGWCTGWVKKA